MNQIYSIVFMVFSSILLYNSNISLKYKSCEADIWHFFVHMCLFLNLDTLLCIFIESNYIILLKLYKTHCPILVYFSSFKVCYININAKIISNRKVCQFRIKTYTQLFFVTFISYNILKKKQNCSSLSPNTCDSFTKKKNLSGLFSFQESSFPTAIRHWSRYSGRVFPLGLCPSGIHCFNI